MELHEIIFLTIHIIFSWNSDNELHEGDYMNINDAIIKRIEEICKEKNINVCGATLNGGKSPSAIYDLIKGRTKCSKVSTIKAFCQGAGITLSEFFDKDYFNDFEE
ncbi:MAG: transcriptional regulator [Clostridia bacterium]|nr:transcriptional regulator [Clostridia bacterium]